MRKVSGIRARNEAASPAETRRPVSHAWLDFGVLDADRIHITTSQNETFPDVESLCPCKGANDLGWADEC